MSPSSSLFLSPLLLFFFFFFFFSTAISSPLFTSLTKDPTSLQYTTIIYQNATRKPIMLAVDLAFSFSWVDCQRHYDSAFYPLILCNSSLCKEITSSNTSSFISTKPRCANDTCALCPLNSVTCKSTVAGAVFDAVALPETDGRNPGNLRVVPHLLFSCSPASLLKGLAKGVSGVLALGRWGFSLPAQVSSSLSLPNVFAVCFSGSPSAPGAAFFGTRGPYFFLPGTDASQSLTYTPLLPRPVGGRFPGEYFVNVTGVRINGRLVNLGRKFAVGATPITTAKPYTVMERSVWKAFAAAFAAEAAWMNIAPVKPVKPFGACFASDGVASTKAGAAVPTVDLVLENESEYWSIPGANSVVLTREGALCLAFLDGGKKKGIAPIVIGGYQLEDNLLQFDLEKMRLGFSSSLLLRDTTCSNFNFTSNSKG